MSSSDLPRLRCDAARRNGSAAVAPPLFSFNSHDEYVDIPFPDYSFWGHELQILNDDQVLEVTVIIFHVEGGQVMVVPSHLHVCAPCLRRAGCAQAG